MLFYFYCVSNIKLTDFNVGFMLHTQKVSLRSSYENEVVFGCMVKIKP